MFVQVLKFYRFADNRHQIQRVDAPCWEEIEAAIREMNGETRTAVTIAMSAESEENMTYTLTVGGGLDGQYTCSAGLGDRDTIHNLLDRAKEGVEGAALMPIGLQWFEVASREIVSLDDVLPAVRAYAERGEIDPRLTWDVVNPYA